MVYTGAQNQGNRLTLVYFVLKVASFLTVVQRRTWLGNAEPLFALDLPQPFSYFFGTSMERVT